MLSTLGVSLSLLGLVSVGLAERYSVDKMIMGAAFFHEFKWETFDDPTHGRVNFVDLQTAQNTNLSWASDDTFVMRADSYERVSPSSRGRSSIRISSFGAWGDSVVILDLTHMPQGCGTWPAFWSLSKAGPWPNGGEIDIVEGVNMNTANLASLHTTDNCKMPDNRGQGGATVSSDCNVAVNNNQGCGTMFYDKPNSYSAGFNANGGGWYALERSPSTGINVWFFPRSGGYVPNDVRNMGAKVDTSKWGQADAHFQMGPNCDYNAHFNEHQIVFDLTFCGDWAGSVYPGPGCSGSCIDVVNNQPEMFREAYWEVKSLRVYTPSVVGAESASKLSSVPDAMGELGLRPYDYLI